MRLVVDANVWISSLLSPGFQTRTREFFKQEYRLIVSEELFDDLESAMRKPYPKRRIARGEYEYLIDKLRADATCIDVRSVVDVCRDLKDNYLLALAKDGNVDYLITGDQDLLVMKEYGKTKIVSLTDFEAVKEKTDVIDLAVKIDIVFD